MLLQAVDLLDLAALLEIYHVEHSSLGHWVHLTLEVSISTH